MSMGKRRAANGFEQDAFTAWKHLLIYMQRPGVASKAKRQANKRDRKQAKKELRGET